MAAKYYFHMVQLVFVHLLVFFYLPFKGNFNLHNELYCDPRDDFDIPGVTLYKCNTFNLNSALVVFYLLYCWQFYLAALQIRHGYPEVRKSNFLMSGSYEGLIKGGDLLFLYTMLPFVMEIKVLLDWTFSRTSLDIYQWFKFTNIHYEIYIFRCGNYEYTKRKTGEAIDVIDKALCGGFFLLLVFVLLVSPLYLFSDLSMANNPVINSNLHFKLMIQNSQGLNSELTLFDTTLVEQITTFDERGLVGKDLEVFFSDENTKDFYPEQIQEVKMSQYSQELWGATPPLKEKFVKALSEEETDVSLQFNVNFQRSAPANALTASLVRDITVTAEKKQELYEIINYDCSAPGAVDMHSVTFPNVMYSTVLMDNTAAAQFIPIRGVPSLKMNVTASYSCKDYWILSMDQDVEQESGLTFYTFNSKIAPSFLTEYTVFTIYTSVIFLFGQLMRMIFVTGTERIPFQVLTYSDSILVLCEQIIICRRQGRLDREETLFWTLMEIIRSQEMMREFTGSTLPSNRPHNRAANKLHQA